MKTKSIALLLLLTAFGLLLPVSAPAWEAVGDYGTATAAAGAATLNKSAGTITSEALTTAAGSAYTLTLTNSQVAVGSVLAVTCDNGTNSTAGIELGRVTPAAGSVVILVWNRHASSALNGTIKVQFAILKR